MIEDWVVSFLLPPTLTSLASVQLRLIGLQELRIPACLPKLMNNGNELACIPPDLKKLTALTKLIVRNQTDVSAAFQLHEAICACHWPLLQHMGMEQHKLMHRAHIWTAASLQFAEAAMQQGLHVTGCCREEESSIIGAEV